MTSVANRVSRAWAGLFSPRTRAGAKLLRPRRTERGPDLVNPQEKTTVAAPFTPQSAKPSAAATPDPQRCQFFFADGRRCRAPRCEEDPALCLRHARALPQPVQSIDLAPPSGEFRTATDVNRALGKVFLLLAQNRIPRRNAVALGYIAQLLLQTLPRVREEINDGLGYAAWQDTLKSALIEDDSEENDETEPVAAANAEHEAEAERVRADLFSPPETNAREVSLGAPISVLAGVGCTCSPRQKRLGCTCSAHKSLAAQAAPAQPKVAGPATGRKRTPAESDATASAQTQATGTAAETAPALNLEESSESKQIPAQVPAARPSYWDQPELLEELRRMYGYNSFRTPPPKISGPQVSCNEHLPKKGRGVGADYCYPNKDSSGHAA